MRAKAIRMPPSRGMAPPESPVPAPRPTNGTWNSRAILTMRRDIRGGAGEDHQVGAVLIDAAIVLVESEVFGAVEEAARTEQGEAAFLAARLESFHYNFSAFRYSRKGPPRSCRRRAYSTVALRKPSLSPAS